MQHFLCGKLVLLLVGIVAVLQVVHLVLLNRLEARHSFKNHAPQVQDASRDEEPDGFPAKNEVEEELSNLVHAVRWNWVLDAGGEYHIGLLQSHSTGTGFDLTLVTQCSYDHLHYLVPLLHQWEGPVSVAVFAENVNVWPSLHEIAKLRTCRTAVRDNVTFSLVWPVGTAGGLPHTPSSFYQTIKPCGNSSNPQDRPRQNYAHHRPYPNNLLRNVARKAALSEFVFVIDIDMLPSSNLRQEFLHLANRSGWMHEPQSREKTVYVVPAFEGDALPRNKSDLMRAVEEGKVRPFYAQLCWKCQAHTDYDTWLHEPVDVPMAPTYDVLWKDPWEPFYISHNAVPFYDEHFKQYGFNRISQVCELHVAGYKFSILNNAYVLHLGFKKQDSFHKSKAEELEYNRLVFRQFKAQLKDKYAESSRRCY